MFWLYRNRFFEEADYIYQNYSLSHDMEQRYKSFKDVQSKTV